MICTKKFVEKPERKRPLGRPGGNGNIMLQFFIGRHSGKVWGGFLWLRIRM